MLDNKSPKGSTIWSGLWVLISIFNLDMAWDHVQQHRAGYHGIFTDKGRLILWSITFLFFGSAFVWNALRWRKDRSLPDATP